MKKGLIFILFHGIMVTAGICQQFQPLWLIQWEDNQKNGYVPLTDNFNGQNGVQVYHLLDSIVFSDTPNYYYVSPYGDDAIARVGDPSRPWRTPWSARADAEDHSVIIVSPGKYSQGAGLDFTGSANLAGKEHTYFFYEGAEVYYTTGPIITFEETPVYGTSIYGRARFESLSASSGRFFSSSSGSPNGNKAFLQAKSVKMGGSSQTNDAFAFVRNDYTIRVELDSLIITGDNDVISRSGSSIPFDNALTFKVDQLIMQSVLSGAVQYFDLTGDNACYDIHIGNLFFDISSPPANQIFFDITNSGSTFNSNIIKIQVDSANINIDDADGQFIDCSATGTGSNNIIDIRLGYFNMTGNGVLSKGFATDVWGSGSTVSFHADNFVNTGTGRVFFQGLSTSADHLAQYNISGNWTSGGSHIFIGQQMEINFSGRYERTGSGGTIFACLGSTGGGDIRFENVTSITQSGTWISTDQTTYPVTFVNVENNPESRTGEKMDVEVYELSPYISVHGDIDSTGKDSIFTAEFLAENMTDNTSNEIRIGHNLEKKDNYARLEFSYDTTGSASNELYIDVSNLSSEDLTIKSTGDVIAATGLGVAVTATTEELDVDGAARIRQLPDSVAVNRVTTDVTGRLYESEIIHAFLWNNPNSDTISATSGVADTLTSFGFNEINGFTLNGTTLTYIGTETKRLSARASISFNYSSTFANIFINYNINGTAENGSIAQHQGTINNQRINVFVLWQRLFEPGDTIQIGFTPSTTADIIIRSLQWEITEI